MRDLGLALVDELEVTEDIAMIWLTMITLAPTDLYKLSFRVKDKVSGVLSST